MSRGQVDDLSRMREFIDNLVADRRTSGAGLAVAIEGEPVFEHYAGQARDEMQAGPDVLWPVASISKVYTGAAIMRLVEQGVLTLGMQVSDVLPEFTGEGRESIVLRQILTHTSGIPYESPQHAERLAVRTPLDGLIDEVYTLDLEFAPGTRQSYSDLGYALAGRVAARTAGVSFEELVRREVLEPAGLVNTYLPAPDEEHRRTAIVEGSIGFGSDTAMYNSAYALGLAHPAFGAVASLSDLLRFGLLFDPDGDRRIHSRAAIETMTSDQTGCDDPGDSVIEPVQINHPWGIGVMIKGVAGSPELASPVSFGHGGASGCYLWIDPRHHVTLAFVSNRHYAADPADFMPRLDQTLNVVLSAVTR